MNNELVTIFAIKRYALHDGPHLRTTVFFKGCPLACEWCHNPEGIDFGIKVISLPDKCVGCSACVSNCRQQALALTPTGISRNYSNCTACLQCVDTCPALAQEATGRQLTIDEVMAEIKKDQIFFDQSGGGVTFSGGEPLSQPEQLLALLKECGKLELHRAVDTSGLAATETLLEVADHTELFLYDLKHMDINTHRTYTGVDNRQIIANFKTLAARDIPVRVRIPLVAGINDSEDNIAQTCALISNAQNVQGVDILPYHPSAKAKYRKLQLKYMGEDLMAPTNERIESIAETFRSCVPDVHIGG